MRLPELAKLMQPLKEIFNEDAVRRLAALIQTRCERFDAPGYLNKALGGLESLEMKDRVKHLATSLYESFSLEYSGIVSVLIDVLVPEELHANHEWNGSVADGISGFHTWPLLTLVELYGLDDFDVSTGALYEMTKRFSAEFAVRPFIERYEQEMFALLFTWAADKSKHVRRLCSEGTRPNLPWAKKLAVVDSNLERNIELLKVLKDDDEPYVQRSVANHLNDISRRDTRLFFSVVESWQATTNPWILRHASRSLLKKGDRRALEIHGYCCDYSVSLLEFDLDQNSVEQGGVLTLSAVVKSLSPERKQKLLIDYVIYFLLKNGTYSRKVFRFRDIVIGPSEEVCLVKKVSFRRISTRQHYSGLHRVALQVNGKELDCREFMLTVPTSAACVK